MTRRALPALVTLVAALTACGGEPADPLEEAGCEGPTEAQTDELFVQTAYECEAGPARVLLFADNEARDSFVEVAEGFGGTYEVGDGWAAENR